MGEDRDEELIDITQYDHGMFKLQRLHPIRLAETIRTAGLIGVEPGLNVLSLPSVQRIQMTSWNSMFPVADF